MSNWSRKRRRQEIEEYNKWYVALSPEQKQQEEIRINKIQKDNIIAISICILSFITAMILTSLIH